MLSECLLIFATDAVLARMVMQGHKLRTSGSVKLEDSKDDETLFRLMTEELREIKANRLLNFFHRQGDGA